MSQLGTRGQDTASPTAEEDPMPALTFSLVPFAPVESARSLPARSTRLILLTCRQRQGCQPWQAQQTRPWHRAEEGAKTSCKVTLL